MISLSEGVEVLRLALTSIADSCAPATVVLVKHGPVTFLAFVVGWKQARTRAWQTNVVFFLVLFTVDTVPSHGYSFLLEPSTRTSERETLPPGSAEGSPRQREAPWWCQTYYPRLAEYSVERN